MRCGRYYHLNKLEKLPVSPLLCLYILSPSRPHFCCHLGYECDIQKECQAWSKVMMKTKVRSDHFSLQAGLPQRIWLQCRRHRRLEFKHWVGKISWRREWQPTPVFLPGKSHGQRSLKGYTLWDCKESDRTVHTNSGTACWYKKKKRAKHCILWRRSGGCHENYLLLTDERVGIYLNSPACTKLFLFAQTWVNITLKKRGWWSISTV